MKQMKKKKCHSYWAYFRRNLWKIVIAFCFTSIATGGNFISTRILSVFVDKIANFNFDYIEILVGSFFLVEVLSKLFARISAGIILKLKTQAITDLRFKLLRKLAESSVETVAKNDPVSLATMAAEDTTNFVDAIHSIYGEVFTIVLGVTAIIYTAIVSWQLAVMLIVSFTVILLVQYFSIKRMVTAQNRARSTSVSAKSLIAQTFQAFEDFKVQTLKIKPLVSQSLDNEVQSNLKAEKVILNNQIISEVLASVVQCIFLGLSIILILKDCLDIGEFVAIFMYKGYVFGLVGAILRIAKNKSKATAANQRMNTILNSEIVSKEKWGNIRHKNPSGEIVIKDLVVNFSDIPVIDHISMKLPAGKFIGIVGDSGCGKSTLLKVLAKAVTPTSGSIKMDGIELSDLTETSYRRAITLAPQSPFLFDFTIKQNLLLANPESSDEEIWDALKQCAADEFVLEKGGLDAIISPKELSGGQIQRIALARIPLRGGKVVLLDESTSALDGESQAVVLKTFRDAADKGHTMVLVAHRVSTLKEADQIIVMDEGKILGTGTYTELYENSEKFRRLADLG